jgi:hypothetical protein
MAAAAALRQCAGRFATSQHGSAFASDTPAKTLRAWRDCIGAPRRLLASGKADPIPRPSATESAVLARIARQIDGPNALDDRPEASSPS